MANEIQQYFSTIVPSRWEYTVILTNSDIKNSDIKDSASVNDNYSELQELYVHVKKNAIYIIICISTM